MQIRSNKTQGGSFADSSFEVRLVQCPPNLGGKPNHKEGGNYYPKMFRICTENYNCTLR